MIALTRLLAVPGTRLVFPWGMLLSRLLPLVAQADPNANGISTFFSRLTADLTVFSLAMATFFFSVSALFYMASALSSSDRLRQHAISSLYAALAGLALAGLAGTFTLLINNASTGAAAGQ